MVLGRERNLADPVLFCVVRRSINAEQSLAAPDAGMGLRAKCCQAQHLSGLVGQILADAIDYRPALGNLFLLHARSAQSLPGETDVPQSKSDASKRRRAAHV